MCAAALFILKIKRACFGLLGLGRWRELRWECWRVSLLRALPCYTVFTYFESSFVYTYTRRHRGHRTYIILVISVCKNGCVCDTEVCRLFRSFSRAAFDVCPQRAHIPHRYVPLGPHRSTLGGYGARFLAKLLTYRGPFRSIMDLMAGLRTMNGRGFLLSPSRTYVMQCLGTHRCQSRDVPGT